MLLEVSPILPLLPFLKSVGFMETGERSLDLESIVKYHNKEKDILIYIQLFKIPSFKPTLRCFIVCSGDIMKVF